MAPVIVLESENSTQGGPVSAPRDCFHVARGIGVILQRITHFSDGDTQVVVELDERILRPQALPDLPLRCPIRTD